MINYSNEEIIGMMQGKWRIQGATVMYEITDAYMVLSQNDMPMMRGPITLERNGSGKIILSACLFNQEELVEISRQTFSLLDTDTGKKTVFKRSS